MNKLIISFFLFLFFSLKLNAQKTDSIIHHLMIIPYQEDYYLSDAEQDIIKQSGKQPELYREYFRKSLDLKITASLETVVPCLSLLHDKSDGSENYILGYQSRTSYQYSSPVNVINAKEKQEETSEEIKNQHEAKQYMTVKGPAKFMNGVFRDTAYLKTFLSSYGCDMVLSINQFEIRTNYNNCIDIANKVYKRELIVHYTLMNIKGKVLTGNYVSAWFPSNSNRDTDIAERVFPQIASELKNNLSGFLVEKNKK